MLRLLPPLIVLALALLAVPVQALGHVETSQPPLVEVRDCDAFPDGREIYVLGQGLGCMGPTAASGQTLAEPGPLVEVKDCSHGEGVYVVGREVVCFKRAYFDIRDCPSPTGQGYGIWVLGQQVVCIP